MNENINLVDILKDTPKGTKLYSPVCRECTLETINDNIIIVSTSGIGKIEYEHFDKLGHWLNGLFEIPTECLLFPSKENRDWSTFKVPQKHKHFEPFEKVLISHFTDDFPGKEIWVPALYGYYDEEGKAHILTNGSSRDDDGIIPYESNEDKLGKSIE